jgi:hypothetical protein
MFIRIGDQIVNTDHIQSVLLDYGSESGRNSVKVEMVNCSTTFTGSEADRFRRWMDVMAPADEPDKFDDHALADYQAYNDAAPLGDEA